MKEKLGLENILLNTTENIFKSKFKSARHILDSSDKLTGFPHRAFALQKEAVALLEEAADLKHIIIYWKDIVPDRNQKPEEN